MNSCMFLQYTFQSITKDLVCETCKYNTGYLDICFINLTYQACEVDPSKREQ